MSGQKEQHINRKVFVYNVYPLGKLCREASCCLISMSTQKLQNIINSMATLTSIFTCFTFEQKESILNWIKSFANNHGEPVDLEECG